MQRPGRFLPATSTPQHLSPDLAGQPHTARGAATLGQVNEASVRRAEAASCHGVIAHRAALACGLTASEVTRLVRRGRWRRLHRGVLWTTPGGDVPLLSRLAAARLAAGDGGAPCGVVSGRSAARLWGLDDSAAAWSVELTLPRQVRRRSPAGVRYRWRTLAPADVTVRFGIPVTTVNRTLNDLARVTAYPQLLVLADRALRTGLATPLALDSVATAVPRRARAALQDADGLAESPFESLVRAELAQAGLPAPVLQHLVRDPSGRVVARVDLAWPTYRLAVEADGAEVHTGTAALRSDLRRQNLLVAAGWTPLRFTWADLGTIASVVAAALTRARRSA